MEKPISIKIKELKDLLIKDIQESNLSAIIIEPILKELYEQILQEKEVQYKYDLEFYNKSLEKEKKDKKEIKK